MSHTILLEKKDYLVKLILLFNDNPSLFVSEVRRKIHPSTYYKYVLPKIIAVNKSLNSMGLDYFINPIF